MDLKPPLATPMLCGAPILDCNNGFLHEYFWFIEIPVKSPIIPTMRRFQDDAII